MPNISLILWVIIILVILDAIRILVSYIVQKITDALKRSSKKKDAKQAKNQYNSSDQPIITIDEDQLDYSKYAFILAKEIAHCDTPTTIGIHGEWGAGKTSLANLIIQYLTPRDTKDLYKIEKELQSGGQSLEEILPNQLLENFEIIKINAWQYASAQALWRALILLLAKRLEERGFESASTKWRQRLYYSISQEVKGEIQLNATTLYIAIFQATLNYLWYLILPSTWVLILLNTVGIKSFGEVTTRFSDLFEHNKYLLMRKQMESIEEFKESLEEIVGLLLKRGEDKTIDDRRLIIFIDDLDRCLPTVALEIMETIKTFLDVSGCVYILLCDQKLLGQGVKTKFKELFGDESGAYYQRGQEYIEKIIQISFQIPPISIRNINKYAQNTFADKYHSKAIPYIDIVSATVGNNPRKIKRLCRGLELAFEMMELSLRKESPSDDSTIKDSTLALSKSNNGLDKAKVTPRVIKDSDVRKKEFAKVYCLQYGWPEAFTLLRENLQTDKIYIKDEASSSSQQFRKIITNSMNKLLINTDLKKFQSLLIIIDWEKIEGIHEKAIRQINSDLWNFLKTEPYIFDIDVTDLRDYVEWSAVIRDEIISQLSSELIDTPVEALDLSKRVFNSLKRTGITTVGDVLELLEKGETAVMSIRNFGEESLDELRDKMREKGYLKNQSSESKK